MSVHIRKRDGSYYVSYRNHEGRQSTRSFGKGREGKRKAEAFDHEWKGRKLRGEEIPLASGQMYMDELAQHWVDDLKMRECEPKWIKSWVGTLNKYILPELSKVPVNELTQSDILRFMMKKYEKNSPTTRNRYVSYLKGMFNFGVKSRLIATNPLEYWRKPKEKPRMSILTPEMLKKIKSHAAPHIQWAIDVAFNLGVRTGKSELLSLKWCHVDWDKLSVRVYATKTMKWRTIPVSTEFLGKLREKRKLAQTDYLIEHKDKPLGSIHKGFRNACNRAGVDKDVISYDIRHLFCTTLLSRGGDLASVSQLMGHASVKMTVDQYYHALPGEKRRAVELLPEL